MIPPPFPTTVSELDAWHVYGDWLQTTSDRAEQRRGELIARELALPVVIADKRRRCANTTEAETSPAAEPDEEIAGPQVDTRVEPTLPPEADEDPFALDPQLEAEAEAEIDNGIPGDDPEADGTVDLDVDDPDQSFLTLP